MNRQKDVFDAYCRRRAEECLDRSMSPRLGKEFVDFENRQSTPTTK